MPTAGFNISLLPPFFSDLYLSQVCRDFYRFFVTEPDPGCLGELFADIQMWETCEPRATAAAAIGSDAYDVYVRTSDTDSIHVHFIRRLLEGSKCRRFRRIYLGLDIYSQDSNAPILLSEGFLSLLRALEASEYRGDLWIGIGNEIRLRGYQCVDDLISFLESYKLPFTLELGPGVFRSRNDVPRLRRIKGISLGGRA